MLFIIKIMLDILNKLIYIIVMTHRSKAELGDRDIINRFIEKCSREHLTMEGAAKKVYRSKGWASLLINGKIKKLRFQTRNLILDFLGDIHDAPHGAGDGRPAQDKP